MLRERDRERDTLARRYKQQKNVQAIEGASKTIRGKGDKREADRGSEELHQLQREEEEA